MLGNDLQTIWSILTYHTAIAQINQTNRIGPGNDLFKSLQRKTNRPFK